VIVISVEFVIFRGRLERALVPLPGGQVRSLNDHKDLSKSTSHKREPLTQSQTSRNRDLNLTGPSRGRNTRARDYAQKLMGDGKREWKSTWTEDRT